MFKIEILLLFLLFPIFLFGQNKQVDDDQTREQINNISSDSIKINLIDRFAYKNRYHKSTFKFLVKAQDIAKHNGNVILISISERMMGDYYFFNSKIDSALIYLNQAKRDIKNIEAPLLKASIDNTLSGIYRRKGNISRAISILLNSKNKLEKIDTLSYNSSKRKRLNTIKIIQYNTLANFYNQMENYNKALYYYDKAYKNLFMNNNFANAGIILSNKGDLLIKLNSNNDALNTLLEAKFLKKKGKSSALSIAFTDLNIGVVLSKLKKYNEALQYLQNALKVFKSASIQEGIMLTKLEIGKLSLINKQYKKAIQLCSESEKIALETGNLEVLEKIDKCLSKSYEKIGNYKFALIYSRRNHKIKDSIFNEKNIKKITQIEMQSKFDKERQLEKIKNATKEKENNLKIRTLILGVISLLVILGLLYYNNSLKRKTNIELKNKNDKIQETLAVNELLLKETHHRVKNNLQIISSLLNMQNHFLTDSKSKEVINDSQNRIKSMSLIHQKLYQEKHLKAVETKMYFTELIDGLAYSFGIDTKNTFFRLEIENLLLDIDTAIPLGLIANELTSNAFKYGVEKINGYFSFIFFQRNDKELLLKIKDNGRGIPDDVNINDSKSYGLRLVKSLSKKLRGTLSFINNDGLEVTLIISKYKIYSQDV